MKDRLGDNAETVASILGARDLLAVWICRRLSALADPVMRLALERDDLCITASRAYRTIRPTAFRQQLLARIFVGKVSLKGFQRFHGSTGKSD